MRYRQHAEPWFAPPCRALPPCRAPRSRAPPSLQSHGLPLPPCRAPPSLQSHGLPLPPHLDRSRHRAQRHGAAHVHTCTVCSDRQLAERRQLQQRLGALGGGSSAGGGGGGFWRRRSLTAGGRRVGARAHMCTPCARHVLSAIRTAAAAAVAARHCGNVVRHASMLPNQLHARFRARQRPPYSGTGQYTACNAQERMRRAAGGEDVGEGSAVHHH